MAEMIKPKKEDIVVFGRIVSASTEGVVANAEQIYDGVSNIRQYEINKKFLSGNYTIGESNIKDGSITRKKIANWAVGRDQIEDGAITNGKILDRSVSTFKIEKSGIRTENIDDYAVTGMKLGNGCITAIKIQPGNIFTSHLDNKAVTSEKLANDVWERLKNEYLRLDGNNSMSSPLKMDGNSIEDVSGISSDSDSPVFINLLNNEVTIGANGDEDNGVPVGQWATIWRDSNFYGNVEAKGFKTHDRANIGFLVNDGSVGLAISDSDIDGLFQQVFQTVIG